MARVGQGRSGKQYRVASKKNKNGALPGADEMREGRSLLEQHMAERRKKGLLTKKKRRSTRRRAAYART